jgi:IS30 family transposase
MRMPTKIKSRHVTSDEKRDRIAYLLLKTNMTMAAIGKRVGRSPTIVSDVNTEYDIRKYTSHEKWKIGEQEFWPD